MTLAITLFSAFFLAPTAQEFPARKNSFLQQYLLYTPSTCCIPFLPHSYLWMEAQGLQLASETKHHELGMQLWRALFTECSLPVRSYRNKMNRSKRLIYSLMRSGLSAKSLKAIRRSGKRSSTIPEYWKDYLSMKTRPSCSHSWQLM